jgi:transcriptional regulator with XRE-family HTH domain
MLWAMAKRLTVTAAAVLRRIRLRLDLSQQEMAEALRVSARTYQRYELGESRKVPSDVVDGARALETKAA